MVKEGGMRDPKVGIRERHSGQLGILCPAGVVSHDNIVSWCVLCRLVNLEKVCESIV